MNKKPFMQDINPRRRSIRDIPLSGEAAVKVHHKKTEHKPVMMEDVISVTSKEEEDYVEFERVYSTEAGSRPRWGKILLWLVVIIACVGGGLFASSFFHSATVGVKVKEVTTQMDSEIKLSRTGDSGVLPFEIVSLSREESQTIPAQGEKKVSSKASGKVVLYNKNLTSQKLLAQTRLESSGGKVYRLGATVVVPAAKKSGTSVTPGSLEVNVSADAAGSDYNTGLTDFTLPGFKGTAKYQSVYARSKTSISGGASGVVKVADPNDIAKAQDALKETLKQQLLDSVNQQKPESFILFADLYSVRYSSSTEEAKDDSIVVKQKGDFVGVLVNSNTLASFLATQSIRGYSSEDVSVSNLQELSFVPSIATSSLTADTSQFTVKVKGNPHFVYLYDASKLKKDLSGMSRESFATVLATYHGIEKGDAKIEPFWRSRFPSEVTKITINEE